MCGGIFVVRLLSRHCGAWGYFLMNLGFTRRVWFLYVLDFASEFSGVKG